MTTIHHLIVGAGPVGSTTAVLLADLGHRVTVLSRSGNGPTHPGIDLVSGDANDVDTLTRHLDGSGALVNAANPPYHRWPQEWPPLHRAMCTAAERTGALLVVMDNLYAFGAKAAMPMRDGSPLHPTGHKGAVRAEMAKSLLDAHAAGTLRAALVRASDFYGPGVRNSAFGDRVVPNVIAGKKVSMLGSLDVPHSVSYMPDVAATFVAIVTRPEAAGQTWLVPNAPAVTQKEMVEAFARAAGTQAKVSALPRIAITIGGIAVPMLRELKETWYQFAEPFTTDSTRTEAELGIGATPIEDGADATVAWWRSQSKA
ncbi:MAG: NAD-dependent epimerase/dehydratase family protein [Actinomycetota bacterium]